MNYGELIGDFKPERDDIYDNFCGYFNNPTMTKIKDIENISMYGVKAYCLTSNTCRYIVIFIKNDNLSIGVKKRLTELKWESFQTRTLDSNIFKNIETLSYIPEEKGPLLSKIHKKKMDDKSCTYQCEDYPLLITLLTDNKKNLDSYQSSGNIILALETWATICTWN